MPIDLNSNKVTKQSPKQPSPCNQNKKMTEEVKKEELSGHSLRGQFSQGVGRAGVHESIVTLGLDREVQSQPIGAESALL